MKGDLSEPRAWHAVRDFSAGVEERCGDAVGAVFVIGSLATRTYRPGRSDIDTLIIVSDACNAETMQAIGSIAASFRDALGIPKGFGAVCIAERKLCPPYTPEEELVPEIVRLKAHGVAVRGRMT